MEEIGNLTICPKTVRSVGLNCIDSSEVTLEYFFIGKGVDDARIVIPHQRGMDLESRDCLEMFTLK